MLTQSGYGYLGLDAPNHLADQFDLLKGEEEA